MRTAAAAGHGGSVKPTQAPHEPDPAHLAVKAAGFAVHGPRTFQGAIFDVDGVLVDSPHYRAWRDALQELMDTESRRESSRHS